MFSSPVRLSFARTPFTRFKVSSNLLKSLACLAVCLGFAAASAWTLAHAEKGSAGGAKSHAAAADSSPATAESAAGDSSAADAYGRLPLGFEPNRGQADARAEFVVRGAGFDLFLAAGEAVFRTRGASEPLRMKVVGADPRSRGEALERLAGVSNYFVGRDPARWLKDVPRFARVRYGSVYPGVDLVFYGNPQQLEYDFRVAPGADPTRIALAFRGARGVRLGEEGDLILSARGGGEVRLLKPVAYQEAEGGARREVGARYHVEGGRVRFRLGAYDPRLPLVIDPVVAYASFLGGSGDDRALGVAVDAQGAAYVAGLTTSLNFPLRGALKNSPAGASDAFVAKLSPDGSALVYATYFGGSGVEQARAVAVDAQGAAYITGTTDSTDLPAVNAFQPSRGSTSNFLDAFVAKLSPSGSTLVYSTYLGGWRPDEGDAIAVDAAGAAYVAGSTGSYNTNNAGLRTFPVTAGAFQTNFPGGQADGGNAAAFVSKLSPAGSALEYSTFLGGLGNSAATGPSDLAFGVAVDSAGAAYVTGRTESERFPVVSAAQPLYGGGPSDAFVTKLNPAGSALVYSTFLGGAGEEDRSVGALAVDAQGAAYATGGTNSTDFPVTGALQPAYGGNPETEAFLTKLDAGGAYAFSTYLGANNFKRAFGVAVDAASNVYLAGTNSVRKVAASGASVEYAVTLGGEGRGVALDPQGNAYVAGITTGPGTCSASGFFPSSSSFQRAYGGGANDAFVTKVAPGSASAPQTFPVYVNAGAFTGRYILSGVGQLQGSTVLNLAPGTYSLDAFGGIAGSDFQFTVNASGQVTGVTNAAAAQGCGNTLQLKTAAVNVEPNAYTGAYAVSTQAATSGPRSFVLIAGLTYIFESGGFIANSTFQFHVEANGSVTGVTNAAAATAAGNTLLLNNAQVTINPGNYAGGYRLNSFTGTGAETFVLIPGLSYAFDDGALVAGSGFQFTVGAGGAVANVSNAAAAAGVGNTLNLSNVVVYVDPTTYTGAYQVQQGYTGLSGQRAVTLVPGLVAFAGTAGGGTYFTPRQVSVTPSSGVVTVGGQSHTFLFSLTPPSTVNIGGFTFQINAPPDEAVVLSNPVSAIQATSFPCSGVDLSALPTIQQKVNRVLTDANTGTQVLDRAQFEARYLNRAVVNDPGADFYVFEIGSGSGNEPFALSVYDPAQGAYTPYVTVPTTPTDYFTCANLRINYAAVDLSALGIAAGARVSLLRFDNLRDPAVNSSGAEISDIMAVHLGPPAGSFRVNFSPGAYTGDYRVGGFAANRPASLTLNPGTYAVDTSSGNDGKFTFTVDAFGQVTNVSRPAAAHGEGGTLVFHNTDLVVEPQGYTGSWTPTTHFNVASFRGRRTVVMIPGLSYALCVGDLHTNFGFTVEAGGPVTNISEPAAAHAEGNVIVLHNAPLTVEPQAFTGNYFPTTHVNVQGFRGRQSIALVPGLRYPLNVGDLHRSFLFTFGADGQVSDVSNPAAAHAEGPTLVLHNATMTVEPQGYAGPYHPNTHAGVQVFTGRRSIVLVPNMDYHLSVGNKFSLFTFTLDAAGQVTNVGNAAAASGAGDTLTLNNSCLHVSPNGFPDNYRLRDLAVLRGEQTVTLVPGLQYVFTDANLQQGQFFNLDAAGQPSPSSLPLVFGGVSYGFTFAQVACDQEAPVTTAQVSPPANAAGWHNSDAAVSLSAADNAGGAGVREITYSASGAQTVAQTAAQGASASLVISAEGETVVTYFATDNAGNREEARTLVVRVDKTAPEISAGAATAAGAYTPGTWTRLDVTVSFGCTDAGSGVASVTAPVTLGADGADQTAAGVCTDVAGNTAHATFDNVDVDKTAPDINVVSPAQGASYTVGQAVAASYACADGGSGVAACAGEAANGGALDTSTVGAKSFAVTAADAAGNTTTKTVVYLAGYGVCALYDQAKAHTQGSTIPVKLRLCGPGGENLSAAGVVVTALGAVRLSDFAPGEVEDAGQANPDDGFRFTTLDGAGGYIFNLQTKGLTTGTYVLVFKAGADPLTHGVQFQIK